MVSCPFCGLLCASCRLCRFHSSDEFRRRRRRVVADALTIFERRQIQVLASSLALWHWSGRKIRDAFNVESG